MVPNDAPSTRDTTRRALLRQGAGACAAGITTLVAGCTSAVPPLGSAQRFGRVDVPPAAEPAYRRWLPAPTAVGLDDAHYAFLLRQPTELDYPAPVRFTTPRKRLLAELDCFGVAYANYDRLLRTPFGTVLEAVDPATAEATLTESGYRRGGTYEGGDVFVRSDVRRRAVVTDGALVWASHRVHGRPNVEALVDAHDGRLPRYHEESGTVRRVTDAVGESRMVEYVPPNDERTWASCEGFRFDGAVAYHVRTFRYPEGETPPEAELRRRSKTGTVLTREVENTDFRVDGRLVTVEGRIPPEAGIQPADVDPPYPPQVTWGYARDSESETVRLRHEAGASVPTAALALRFDADVDGRWTRPADRSLPTERERLGPGDAVTVDVRDVPAVTVFDPDDVDDAADPAEAGERRPATRLVLAFVPESASTASRALFSVELEGNR